MNRTFPLVIAGLLAALPAQADPDVTFDRFDIRAEHRSAPIAAGIWSPVRTPTYVGEVGGNLIFHPVPAYIGAAVPDERLPLIIVSHGSGASMDGTAWLASGLAAKGAHVVVLNHPGTTSGDSSPRRTVRLAERGADLSATLHHIMNNGYFSARIDAERITALGFSLGGAAVLGVAGQRLDRDAYAAYCEAEGDAAQDCSFLARGGVDFDALPPEFSADMRDDRFTSIVAVDPGFTYAATASSQAEISVPVQVLTLGDDVPWRTVDVRAEGSGLIERIPNAEHVLIPGAHHFSFLPLCTAIAEVALIEEGEDPICTDPEGSDRAAVHAASIEAIARFLEL
ncbi:MAG: alpha/beta fold hydrolase [Pseudomonadota bacterium]